MEPSGAHSSTSLRCYSRSTVVQVTTSSSPANDPSASSTCGMISSAPGTPGLVAVTAPLHPTLPIPSVLIQVLDTGTGPRRPKWLEAATHKYAHLLQVTVLRHSALLAVQAAPPELCAYSASFAPPDALEELTASLLSWTASAMPFKFLTANQLRRAAASDDGRSSPSSRAPP